MASELFVDKITGKTGTSGGAPITLSGDTATLGSGVTFPANTVQFIDSASHTSDQSNTNTTTTYEPSNLSITIPSATVTKYSKLKISFSWAIRIQAGSSYTFINWKVERSNPSVSTLQEHEYYGHQTTTVVSVRDQISGAVIDSSLGTGDHTYKFYAKVSGNGYAGTIYLDGSTNSQSWVIAEGIV